MTPWKSFHCGKLRKNEITFNPAIKRIKLRQKISLPLFISDPVIYVSTFYSLYFLFYKVDHII